MTLISLLHPEDVGSNFMDTLCYEFPKLLVQGLPKPADNPVLVLQF